MQYFFLSPSVLVCINRFEITVDQIIMFIKKCDLKNIFFFTHQGFTRYNAFVIILLKNLVLTLLKFSFHRPV